MSSAYRDAAPPAEPDDEPLPAFRPKANTAAGVAFQLLVYFGPAGLAVGLSSDRLGAAKECGVVLIPALVVTALVLLLERPVREWYARRYARRVQRGILELESKV